MVQSPLVASSNSLPASTLAGVQAVLWLFPCSYHHFVLPAWTWGLLSVAALTCLFSPRQVLAAVNSTPIPLLAKTPHHIVPCFKCSWPNISTDIWRYLVCEKRHRTEVWCAASCVILLLWYVDWVWVWKDVWCRWRKRRGRFEVMSESGCLHPFWYICWFRARSWTERLVAVVWIWQLDFMHVPRGLTLYGSASASSAENPLSGGLGYCALYLSCYF